MARRAMCFVMPGERKWNLMLVCGEPSGDLHGAELVAALSEMADVEVLAAGGPNLAAAGAKVAWDSTRWGAIGVPDALLKLLTYRRAMRELVLAVETHRDLHMLILVDFGAFNLRLAARIRRRRPDLPIFYYFPPASWDKRRRYWARLLHLSDYIATPFPWSAAILASQGATVRWVGHPAVDRISPPADRGAEKERLGVSRDSIVVGLFPGSRRLERDLLGPVFLEAGRLLRQRLPKVEVFWSQPSWVSNGRHSQQRSLVRGLCSSILPRLPGLGDDASLGVGTWRSYVRPIADPVALLRAADVALTCFGTITLEAALADCPIVSSFRGTLPMKIQYRLMRIPTPYYSMPNIIVGEPVVPEIYADAATPVALAEAAYELLTARAERERILAAYARVREELGPPGAARRAAEMVLQALHGELRPHRRVVEW
ncbi:MAG: hypothetical protein N2512_13385 [Armatimonadetes bacterium]|nr:hypothetical protein [Armatimonadota bacterium]